MRTCKYLYLIIMAVLSFLVSCSQNVEKQDAIEIIEEIAIQKIPTFLVYGELPPVGYAEEEDSVATQKFGFQIKRIAGCEITGQLVDSVKTINQKNNLLMISKHGNDWKQKFETATELTLQIPEI